MSIINTVERDTAKSLYVSPRARIVETSARRAILAASNPNSPEEYGNEDW